MPNFPPLPPAGAPSNGDLTIAGGIAWWLLPAADVAGLRLAEPRATLRQRVELEALVWRRHELRVRYCAHDPAGFVYFAVQRDQRPPPDEQLALF